MSVADENMQSDFLVMFAQICAHMEATGKLPFQILFRQFEDSAEGKEDFKTNIKDKGITDPVNVEKAIKHV